MTIKEKRDEIHDTVAGDHGKKYADELFEEVDELIRMVNQTKTNQL